MAYSAYPIGIPYFFLFFKEPSSPYPDSLRV
jgi:hypothetical protein